jgi:hypothetical protein
MRLIYSFRLASGLLALSAVMFLPEAAHAQFGKLKEQMRKVENVGDKISRVGKGNSELASIVSAMNNARLKSAYARVSLSLADDIIRRQALLNSTKKSTKGQIEKDQQEVKELDKSIVEKRKLLADLGRKNNSGKYDDETKAQYETGIQQDEQKREEKRAMIDAELEDRDRRKGEMSKQERDNYALLAKVLWGASKQEKEAMETARDTGPRAQSVAQNADSNSTKWLEANPKQFQEGIEAMNQIVTEGPAHLATLTRVANHFARIGGVDLSKDEFQAKVVTSEDELPADWK